MRGNYKHGGTGTAEYEVWKHMKSRCYNKNCKDYYYYGGRGVKVCDKWKDSFEDFLQDIGIRPSRKHSIDRIDGNGDYAPGNCRWATAKEQAINRRVFGVIPYRGVSVYCIKKIFKGYTAKIYLRKEVIHLGVFQSAVMAALAYDKAVLKSGKNLLINFPELKENYGY